MSNLRLLATSKKVTGSWKQRYREFRARVARRAEVRESIVAAQIRTSSTLPVIS
jgi:hypothetical protein